MAGSGVQVGSGGESEPRVSLYQTEPGGGKRSGGASEAHCGVDKLALNLPVAERLSIPFKGINLPINDTAKAHVRMNPNSEIPVARLEFNPSRVIDPEGMQIVDAEELTRVTGQVVEHFELSLGTEVVGHGEVSRIDVATDFQWVERAAVLFPALSLVHRPHARQPSQLFADPRDGSWSGVVFPYSDERIQLYDKHNESHGLAPRGTLRFEAQLHRKKARSEGLDSVGDITQEILDAVAKTAWDRSRLGTKVASVEVIEGLVESTDWTDRDKTMFVGHLHRRDQGRDIAWSNDRRVKYNKQLAELGLTTAQRGGETPCLVYLDWESRREVVELVDTVGSVTG